MYYFKQESKLIKQLLAFLRKKQALVNPCAGAKLVLVAFSCISLAACGQVLSQKKGAHNLIKTPAVSSEAKNGTANRSNRQINLSGVWKIGFRYQGKAATGSMQIQQNNQSFVGQGEDEQGSAKFKIEQGVIKGDEILFLKRYDKHPNQSVQYHGQFTYLPSENGEVPYMGGDFSIEQNGAVTVGDWEAAKAEIPAPVQNNKKASDEQAPVSQQSHSRDLSGKWNVAYEYNFKTIHSTMFLEQDGNRIGGHGMDAETKEKFIIKKGWYSFPRLTLIRQYPGRSGNNIMTFKAEVSEVADKDYTGPYLSGKTQGGGEWEAERVN